MVNYLSSWAENIVISVVIVTLLEMIIPESKNKKYVKMVMSIYILFTIMSPIVKNVSSRNIDFSNLIKIDNKEIDTTSIETNASVINVYKESIKKDLKSRIEEEGYNVEDIDVVVENRSNENLGKIQTVNIKLTKEKNNAKVNAVKIEIGVNKGRNENKQIISHDEVKSLKELISSTYGVDENNINIT